MKTLVLFTSFFPYGNGEAFIESEFPYLCNSFDKIIIVTNELKVKTSRTVPEKVTIVRYPYSSSLLYKVRAVLSFNLEIFKDEVKFIRGEMKLSLVRNVLFTLLGSIAKGYETRDFIIHRILKKYSLNLSETWFYAYWMNDMAIGLAMLKAKFPEAKTLCRAHRGDLYFYTTTDHYLPLRKFLLAHLNKCYVIAQNGFDYLKELLGEEATANVEVSKLGTMQRRQKKVPSGEEVPVLLSCSSFTLPKRVPLIANALSLLNNTRLKWLHFGYGPLQQKVEKEAAWLLEGKREIEFLSMGKVMNEELMNFYSESPVDLFINVSSSEGIPVSIMEAMSFGIPVIATAAGGTAEIVRDGYNGYLLNVIATPDEIADAIKKYFSLDDSQKSEMGNNAYQTWSEFYNAGKNFTRFTESVLAL